MGLFGNSKKSKKPAGTKSSARAQGVATAKQFNLPHEFDYIYKQLMRFAATLYSPNELTVSIAAYEKAYSGHPAGEITLTLSSTSSLDWRREFLYKEDTSSNKGLYNLFYGEVVDFTRETGALRPVIAAPAPDAECVDYTVQVLKVGADGSA